MMKLNHLSLRTLTPEVFKDFFGKLLGLTEGFRPNFDFPGYWLYGSDPNQAIVHLIGQKKNQPKLDIADNTGAFDHMAFQSDDYDLLISRIKENDFEYQERGLPGGLARQVFVKGPHNILIEIVFPST